MAEEVGQSVQTDQGRPRLGSFELGVRDSTFSQQGDVVAVHATGVPGSAHAGYPATCYCRSIPAESASAFAANPWLSELQTVRHDRITPVIDAGVAGKTAYYVEPAVSGERISQRLRNKTETTPAQVGRILAEVLEAVKVAWQAGFDLVVTPDTVRMAANGRAEVSLALSICLNPKSGPGSDATAQFQLAGLATILHSGKADQTSLGLEQLHGPDRTAALSNFREQLGNLAEHVAIVLARTLNPDPAQRYPTVDAFVAAYGEALKATADDLAFGAIEAKNRDNSGMASVYAELIKRYDEHHPEVAGPGGRLGATYQNGSPPVPMPEVMPPLSASLDMSVPPAGYPEPGDEPQLTPEIVAMLAGPAYQVTKPKSNPWFMFAAGIVFIFAIFLFLAFLAMTNS